MRQSVDEDEHSLEMHLPYIYKMLSRYEPMPLATILTSPHLDSDTNQRSSFSSSALPPLVPIMVGSTSPTTEVTLGKLLAPYLSDPSNAFVVSSDFAHWGTRFRYTLYRTPTGDRHLTSADRTPASPAIHESIAAVDQLCIDACETGSHKAWTGVLRDTGNTVCGRHPIGVMLAGIEEMLGSRADDDDTENGRFRFVRYERSSLVVRPGDSSVSYASAYAVL